ncbi:hypothetical protein [Paraflavitalea speifideaquila]|uniref:hypothetical protein n=1 Tax=Paraflavitalea speifideaquila TaxID=3076558 RepID=UPI0028EE85C1|nr:hypothetical protein [Paraflavitalea speifideiaquila]
MNSDGLSSMIIIGSLQGKFFIGFTKATMYFVQEATGQFLIGFNILITLPFS